MLSCQTSSSSQGKLRQKTLVPNGPNFRWQSTYEQLSLEDKVLAILDFCSPLNGQEFIDAAKQPNATLGDLRISAAKIQNALVPLLNRKIFVPAAVPEWPASAIKPALTIQALIQRVRAHVTGGAN